MDVAFTELAGSPKLRIDISGRGTSGTRIFKCAWSDYLALAAEIIGSGSTVGGIVVGSPTPSNFPGWPQLLATHIEVEPFVEKPNSQAVDLTSVHNSYPLAKLTVQYGLREATNPTGPSDQPEVPEGTVLEYSSEAAGEFVTIPGTGWKWGNDPKDPLSPEANNGVIVGTEAFTYQWSRIPAPPWAKITAAKGKLNEKAFAGHEPGHVMFLGAQRRITFQTDTSSLWSLGMQFKARSIDWRKTYRAEPAAARGWQFTEDANGDHPFELYDFAELFKY